MRIKVAVEQAKATATALINEGSFVEAFWITNPHHMDVDYNVGDYVTEWSTGDWTDHPNYSGVDRQDREDNEPVLEWVLRCLPTETFDGTVTFIAKEVA